MVFQDKREIRGFQGNQEPREKKDPKGTMGCQVDGNRSQIINPYCADNLDPVVQKVDSTIHQINHYPADNTKEFVNTYLLDSDLFSG